MASEFVKTIFFPFTMTEVLGLSLAWTTKRIIYNRIENTLKILKGSILEIAYKN